MQNNNFFEPLENTRPYLKAAFEGFSGTGKSFTSGLVAIGIHQLIKSTKPIALYYTERAGKGALTHFYKERNIPAIVKESRTLADWQNAVRACENGASDILVTDSVTHIWENYIQAFMDKNGLKKLDIWHWGQIKPGWKKGFSDVFLEAKCHIIFTGRAGYEYDTYIDDQGKKQTEKSGIKMKVEGETEYEPDLVVLMDKIKDMQGDKQVIRRTAQIVKDRTTVIDGKSVINPSFNFFLPAVKILLAGVSQDDNFDETPDDTPSIGSDNESKRRTILLEEIRGIFDQFELGQTATGKAFKADVSHKVFDTRSWKAIELLNLDKLETGKTTLEKFLNWFKEYFQGIRSQGIEFNKDHALKELDRILTPQNPADQWLADNDGKTFTPRAQAQSSSPDPFGEFDDLPNIDTDPEPVEYPEPDPVPQQQKQPSTNGQAAQIDLF